MNSLSYVSRQFDVLASSSAPNTPPSTPTGELGPGDPRPSLKRIRTWASARAFFLPQDSIQRRYTTQPPIRVRKRSGSTPFSPRFQFVPSGPASNSFQQDPAVIEQGEIRAVPQTHSPVSSMPLPQPKTVSTKESSWLHRLYFLRVICLLASWLRAIWNSVTRSLLVDEPGTGKGKGIQGQEDLSEQTSSNGKESDPDAVRSRETRSKASLSKASFVRARASSIIKIALQPQTKPPTPSPPSQPTLGPPPTFNLIPPDQTDDTDNTDNNVRCIVSLDPPASLSTATLTPQTPPSKRASQSTSSRPSTPAKATPLHMRKTLVLDLDETLIHSTTRPLPSGGRNGLFNLGSLIGFGHNRKAGHIVEVVMNNRSTLYHVYKRPFVDYFLRKVSAWYTLVIFTASMKEYADPVIDWLDAGRGILSLRFFREHCTQLPNGSYSKDLSILNEDLARICLIDNSPASYSINKANGIPIEGWTHDPYDEALLDLLPVLDSLRFTGDVRHILGLRGF
ncbi:NIF-domain-containing protein [Fomitiporia mediterranea MF3/22]|uniref:NIF-domain-containing protein n=1 Tax=Fomitiporia mediterranea (strain MF3/22) TaxID=694068 RepID=UPI0004407EE5|nr:NIF-domain-containing protein [Fomitiporia mediterranea MF3/22]EJD01244.1 NIF-domain-containing protein [Fomitiporia mediterranea MF3/22]